MAEKLVAIEVDAEVFEYLQARARAFVDRPNDVLRRLLIEEHPDSDQKKILAPVEPKLHPKKSEHQVARKSMHTPINANRFVQALLKQEFDSKEFHTTGRYRLMFESEESIVYIQNFNKRRDHLWYRLNARPWKELRSSRKAAWVCFTNPPKMTAYVIPVKEIVSRARSSGWDRDHLEVNIDPTRSRWTELDWAIEKYKITIVTLPIDCADPKIDQALQLFGRLSPDEKKSFIERLEQSVQGA